MIDGIFHKRLIISFSNLNDSKRTIYATIDCKDVYSFKQVLIDSKMKYKPTPYDVKVQRMGFESSSGRRCPNCGRIIPEDAGTCPYCSKKFW